jgi:replicative DNA helicase
MNNIEPVILSHILQNWRENIDNIITLKPEFFQKWENKIILLGLKKILEENLTFDLPTLHLICSQISDKLDVKVIANLFKPGISFSIKKHLFELKEKYNKEQIRLNALDFATLAGNDKLKSVEILKLIENKVFDLNNLTEEKDETFDLEKSFNEKLHAYETCIPDLNKMSKGGFFKNDYNIIAARPGMGKTTFALNCLLLNARKNIFSLLLTAEMSEELILYKLFNIITGIDFDKIRTKNLNEKEKNEIRKAYKEIKELPLKIKYVTTLSEVKNTIIKYNYSYNDGLCFIDYFQLLKNDLIKTYDKLERFEDMSGQLLKLANTTNFSLNVLAQLSRKIEERIDKTPLMSDLKQCGKLEQDAVNIYALYAEEEKIYCGVEERNYILGLKQRFGQQYVKGEFIFNKQAGLIYGIETGSRKFNECKEV